jgi:hypothetical protein
MSPRLLVAVTLALAIACGGSMVRAEGAFLVDMHAAFMRQPALPPLCRWNR